MPDSLSERSLRSSSGFTIYLLCVFEKIPDQLMFLHKRRYRRGIIYFSLVRKSSEDLIAKEPMLEGYSAGPVHSLLRVIACSALLRRPATYASSLAGLWAGR
jgi:hypothetical protein